SKERAAILRDPDFDCLAANTAAGALICSDPELALAEEELNGQVLGLIGKLNPTEARFAFAEYGRWTRERDRKCDLVEGERAAGGLVICARLSRQIPEPEDRRYPWCQGRSEAGVRPPDRCTAA